MTPMIQRSIMALAFFVSIFAAKISNADYYTCYENEYRCETHYENSCHQERSCYLIPGERQCSQERVCETRTEPPRCETYEECGTNALGEPICKPREHCSGGGTVEECGYVERCYDSGQREECSYRDVCESRPVESCGYVSVPKQCYRPDPIDPTPVDPQPVDPWPVDPTPVDPWPVDPTPVDPWPVDPTPVDPTPVDPGPVDPEPPVGIGPKSVQKLFVSVKDAESTLTFKDKGQSITYRTRYFISIYDAAGDLIVNQFSSEKAESQKIVLNQNLSPNKRYKLVMRVVRTGGELVKDVDFTKSLDF